jgi:predicted acyl esterase
LGTETKEHPFYDSFWETKTADFSKITQPAYIVAGWPDAVRSPVVDEFVDGGRACIYVVRWRASRRSNRRISG